MTGAITEGEDTLKITEQFRQKTNDLWGAPDVTLAFLGDSVTQGCFECYRKTETSIETVFDQEHAYHAELKRLLSTLWPNVPVNILNAGISGDNAPHALSRLERDIISRRPDLCTVCFGLNDSGRGEEGLPAYESAIRRILTGLKEAEIETIFLTPNMMCTYVSCHLSDSMLRRIAEDVANTQNNGILDRYLDRARAICADLEIPVCDVYAKWKAMAAAGVDTTDLLANYINHPTRELNRLTAYALLETITAPAATGR